MSLETLETMGRMIDVNKLLGDARPDNFGCRLGRVTGGAELLEVLSRYVAFNSVFASGVTDLASHIRLRDDIFRNPGKEPTSAPAKIAGAIFFAAIAEFGDRRHVDHRTLALITLDAAARYLALETPSMSSTRNATAAATRDVLAGYGVDQQMDDQQVFFSIGFHIGSETLADEEFNTLDGFLQAKWPGLVDCLQNTKVKVGDITVRAYDWIHVHTTVEADHSSAAAAGANYALRYYAGSENESRLQNWLADGARRFASVQGQFMCSLLS